MPEEDNEFVFDREPRHFITREPPDPEDPDSVRRWLQVISDEITRYEDFDVKVHVLPDEDTGGQGDGDPAPGEPVSLSYKFDINPCPGKRYVGPGGVG